MMRDLQPFSTLHRLHDEMLRQLDGQENRSDATSSPANAKTTAATWAPPVDVIDDGEKVVFEVDVPGVRRDAISLKVEKRILTIEGQRKLDLAPKADLLRMERATGPFSRSFRLPDTVDADSISAELSDGVLRVTLPSKREAMPRTIEIK